MENANQDQGAVRQWVAQQTSVLDPPAAWQPDLDLALVRFHARQLWLRPQQPWHRRLTTAAAVLAAAALFVGIVLLFPAGRVVAQQFWQLLTVRQVVFIRVNPWPEGVPSPSVNLIGTPFPPIPARDLDEVRRRVNYDPRLPRSGVLSSAPRLSTTFSLAAGAVVKVGDMELALRKAGVLDQTVPPQWDGAQLALHTSSIVIAEWPNLVLVQSLPLKLSMPQGFDFPAFSAMVLRIMGVGPDEARQLAERAGTAPPWLAPLARNFGAYEDREQLTGRDFRTSGVVNPVIEEIRLNSGFATLAREEDRITILWSVPDRVYALRGTLSRELSIAVANAVQ